MRLTVAEVARRVDEYQKMKDNYDSMLEALKAAYLKHHCGYSSTTCEEIIDKIHDALIKALGPTGLTDFLKQAINRIEAERTQ